MLLDCSSLSCAYLSNRTKRFRELLFTKIISYNKTFFVLIKYESKEFAYTLYNQRCSCGWRMAK